MQLIGSFVGAFRLDTVTGNFLAIAGKMPLICSRNVAASEILDFFRLSGLEPAGDLYTYKDQEEAIEYAKQFIAKGVEGIIFLPAACSRIRRWSGRSTSPLFLSQ